MDRNKGQCGFSLIELLIATVIMVVVIMMSSDVFTIILAQSGQQTKVVSSGIESIIGLRMLRYDIEHAGYGLPGQFQNAIQYDEAVDEPPPKPPASPYNDSQTGVPRGIITGNNTGFNGSDYLVIKSTIAGTSDAVQGWTSIVQGSDPKPWGSGPAAGSRVVVIKPKSDKNSQNELVMNGTAFFTKTQSDGHFPSTFSPQKAAERFIIYGVVDPDPAGTDPRMPFNRADYYIDGPALSPSCAPHTGVLYKATVNNSNSNVPPLGGHLSPMPIIDCVADMQIILGVDTDTDGVVDTYSVSTSTGGVPWPAQQIRDTVKEVRVYILAQEGQRDPSYTHTPATVPVGETGPDGVFRGSSFNLATTIGTGWQNYRWKVYTLVVNPEQFQ